MPYCVREDELNTAPRQVVGGPYPGECGECEVPALLLNFDGNTADSARNRTVTTSGSISYTTGKSGFGQAVVLSSGTVSAQLETMQNTDWVIEGWFYMSAAVHTDVLFTIGGAYIDQWGNPYGNGAIVAVYDYGSGPFISFSFRTSTGGDGFGVSGVSFTSLLNTWTHFALVRAKDGPHWNGGERFKLFINGELWQDRSIPEHYFALSPPQIKFGPATSVILDDIRVTIGSDRGYGRLRVVTDVDGTVVGPGLTVPTEPYPTPITDSAGAITITSQPKNNFSSTNDPAIFSVAATASNSAPLVYQWQYYDIDWDTGNIAWLPIPGPPSVSKQPASVITSVGVSTSGFYTPTQIRCVVDAPGCVAVTSNVVRWVDAENALGALYFSAAGQLGACPNDSELRGGRYYDIFNTTSGWCPGLQAGESIDIFSMDMGMGSFDTSWYSSNATTWTLQVSDDAIIWTTLSTQNARGTVPGTINVAPSSGTKYYRIMATLNWPFTTTNGTENTTKPLHTPRFVYGIRVTWP